MKVVFLGATKGMGRALARLMAARGDQIFLLGRNADDVTKSAADLSVRGGISIEHALCDLEHPETFEPALEAALSALGTIDTVVITAGIFGTQEQLEKDPRALERLLQVDFTNTILFAEAARKRLGRGDRGSVRTLCVFGSVAGDRGRKPVVLYGAAKAGLAAYLEGLDHRFHRDGLRVVSVKPGFVHTAMTAGLKAPPFAGHPEPVARRVLRAIDRGTPVVYAPGIWQWIMLVIRYLPRAVMRRIGF